MIGARLKQARLLAGMTLADVADELQAYDFTISKQAISKYEREQSHPPAQFLLLASSVLGVPSTYFTHISEKTVEWLAFRCRQRLNQKERSRIKAYASDVAELQIELRELLYPHSMPELPLIPVETLADAEEAAEQLRAHWDVGDRPLDNLVQMAEDREVIVIDWADKTGLFDGLSGWCDNRPVTVVNTSYPLDRRRLTLAHEIGHLVMDTKPATDIDEETLAFRFAAALLLPAKYALKELGCASRRLNWRELGVLKRKYGLSMSAWVRRAYDLNIISASTYKAMNIDYKSRGWHKGEPVQYIGDEEPLLLKQMAGRAVTEGLINVDRVTLVSDSLLLDEDELLHSTEYPSATELLEMHDEERDMWMSKMFDLAQNMEFEVFEAYGEEDFETWE